MDTSADVHKDRALALMRELGGLSSKALLVACAHGDLEAAAYLIQHQGADTYFLKSTDRATPLHIAVYHGHLDVARLLVKEFDVDVAVTFNKGVTALHIAAQTGNAEAARVLVEELGAPTESRTSDGWTPIHVATLGKHKNVVRALAALGADTGGGRGGEHLQWRQATACRHGS